MIIKLITLNIFQGFCLGEACAFLEQEKPDIVTLQEVYAGEDTAIAQRFRTFQEVRRRLQFAASDFVPAFIDNRAEGKIPEGNAIFSRFPIKARDAVFFNEPFRDDYFEDIKNNPIQPHVLQHVVLQTPSGDLDVFNVHGPWDLDGDNYSQKRQQMAEAIIAGTKGKPRVLVAGDTNARPTNQAIQDAQRHLTNVFGTELKSTFNMRRKENPGYATSVVDMVFTSPGMKVVAKSCPDVDVSDHLPLIVTVEL